MKSLTYHLNDLDQAATWLLKQLEGHIRVIAFHGAMGAGKTTLCAALARKLGSEDAASSPSFSIIQEYALPGGKHMYHMDWYRLTDVQEAVDAGVEAALDSGSLCLVEWPEKAAELLPPETLHVQLEAGEDQSRVLKVMA